MPDTPDYSKYGLQSVRFSLQDMGELAVRLGSSDWFQRLGNVVYMDNMQTGLAHFVVNTSGVGSAVNVIASSESVSGYAIKLTAGPGANRFGAVDKYLPPLPANKHGIEAAFAIETIGNDFTFDYILFNPEATYHMNIQFAIVGKLIRLLNQSAAYTTVYNNFQYIQSIKTYNHFKLTADLAKGKYLKLVYNNLEFDVSNVSFAVTAGSNQPHFYLRSAFTGDGLGTENASLGLIIVTTDEP